MSPMASAHHAQATVWSVDHQGITLDGGDVVIHGNDGTEARIMPDGTLFIAGKPQKVTPEQQQQLTRYVSTVQDMQAKGLALASETGSFAIGVVDDVMADLFSGDSGDQIDEKANRRANEFKKKALPICRDVQTLKQIQDSLQGNLAAFKPYAVIEAHDTRDCEHNINSDD